MKLECRVCGNRIRIPDGASTKSLFCNKCQASFDTKEKKDHLKEGTKHDSGKLRYDLIPWQSLEELVKVYTFGAQKYEDWNWAKGLKYSRIFGAIMRHLWAWWRGEKTDEESQLHPLAHAAWGCFTLIWYDQNKSEFDDRRKIDNYSNHYKEEENA